ncbi:MAG: prolyl oligopeptidase family serine peptidase [Phycisphaerae bacterium]|nr:prolyl oligopeptidase family serine peptidase [Phycisphaerae bacterium]
MQANRMHRLVIVSAILLGFSTGPTIAAPAGRVERDSLPQVLIIGDSISIGYMKALSELLKDKAIVRHNPGNAGHTGMGLSNIKRYIGKTKWDVIHFNWGLWDLCYRNSKSKNQGRRDKVNGKLTHTLEQYQANLHKLVKELKTTDAKLIWASTTPVPDGEAGRVKGDELKYNAVAAKIMAENKIAINDLHAHMTRRLEDFEKKGNVHFDAAGSKHLAEKVAAEILKVLPAKADSRQGVSTFPGKIGKWNGFTIHDFRLDGRGCRLVVPDKPAPARPWIWRARFFGHEPQTDIALLKKGFHVAYIGVGGLYGAPPAVKVWDGFHKYLTTKHKLAAKPALEGMSRGGLIIYNWAAKNPDKVSCIYGDAPVCDIRSWPGKKGVGCMKVYGITVEQLDDFKENPIDHLAPMAKAKVPLLIVAGDADRVVPIKENALVMKERYEKLGGPIKLIVKKGVDHHPHSLKDPTPIVEFILKHTPLK